MWRKKTQTIIVFQVGIAPHIVEIWNWNNLCPILPFRRVVFGLSMENMVSLRDTFYCIKKKLSKVFDKFLSNHIHQVYDCSKCLYTYQLNVISTKFQIKNEIILENGIFSPWKMWLVKWALLLYVYVFDIKPRPHVRRKSFHYHFDTYFSSSTYCTYTIKCHQSSPLRR